jgi:hypothetical protein
VFYAVFVFYSLFKTYIIRECKPLLNGVTMTLTIDQWAYLLAVKKAQQPDDSTPTQRAEQLKKAQTAKVFHHTVGVYSSGDHKSNCVPDFELDGHVDYNTRFRPGRALFVDGKCVHQGYLSGDECKVWEARIKNWPMPKLRYPRH